MNAVEGFVAMLEWLILYSMRVSTLVRQLERKVEKLPKASPLRAHCLQEIAKREKDGRWNFDLDYRGSVEEMFSRYGEGIFDRLVYDDPEQVNPELVALQINLSLMAEWAWNIRRFFAFDFASQSSLRKIDLTGLKWSDLHLPFPVTILEFQAEFFVAGEEFDSVVVWDNEETDEHKYRLMFCFYSRKMAKGYPNRDERIKLLKLVRESPPETSPLKSFGERIEQTVFIVHPFVPTLGASILDFDDRGVQLCARALVALMRQGGHAGFGVSTPACDSGLAVLPENYFRVEAERAEEVSDHPPTVEGYGKDNHPKRELCRHPRRSYYRAPPGMAHLGIKTIKVEATVVRRDKPEQMPIVRVKV